MVMLPNFAEKLFWLTGEMSLSQTSVKDFMKYLCFKNIELNTARYFPVSFLPL